MRRMLVIVYTILYLLGAGCRRRLGTNVSSEVRCPEILLSGLPNGYHSMHPYGFSGSFGGVVSPIQLSRWTIQ